jgi:twitching motility protein PilT
MALEILVPNSAIRNLIREDKIHQIYGMMQTGQDKFGMQTFNQALLSLYLQRQITLELAMARSHNADELQDLINRATAGMAGGPGVPPGGRPMPPGGPGQRPGMPPPPGMRR